MAGSLLFSFLPPIFGTLALILGVYANFGCTTFSFPFQGGGEIFAGLLTYKTKGYAVVGDEIWVADVCALYDNLGYTYTTDGTVDTVFALAIAAAVLGGIGVLMTCLLPCAGSVSPMIWKGTGVLFLIGCGLQGATLVLYNSSICTDNPLIQYLQSVRGESALLDLLVNPDQCEWGSGYKMNISSVVMWFVAAAATICLPSPGGMDNEN